MTEGWPVGTSSSQATLKQDKNSFYPNPVHGKLTIKTYNDRSATLQMADITGKEIMNKQINNNETIDVSNVQPGIYLIKIGQSNFKKLIIK
ncbi:MAG: T9SS type A sorting domain-containing protein [Bacteroidales bacterium]|nr:T9SS type A sorting domain-containing protein [Bacteroidales bacterium]